MTGNKVQIKENLATNFGSEDLISLLLPVSNYKSLSKSSIKKERLALTMVRKSI